MKRIVLAAALAVPVFASSHVTAQSYPSKPIRLVVPFPPGGGVDLTARMMQPTLSAALGQPIVIDNRGGAAGQIGAEIVARSAPDGYTIVWTVGSELATKRYVAKGTFLDPLKDLTPIASALESVSCIAVSPSLPVNSLEEFIAYAKKYPGKLNFSSAGINTAQHIAGELLRQHGVDMVHVPFSGLAPALVAVISGQVQVAISNLATVGAAARDGKVKVLALTRSRRFEGAPHIPAINEALPGVAVPVSLWGFFGPGGLPEPIVQRLSSEVGKAIQDPGIRKKGAELSMSVNYGDARQFAEMIRETARLYEKIVKAAGITPQ